MRRWLRIIGINLALMLLGVIVLEAGFGSWIFGPRWGTLTIVRNQHLHTDASGIYAGGGRVRFTRDQYGLRGEYEALSALGMLVLGGSTTNELYIDDEETWTFRLGRLFKAAGYPVPVVNAGADGQTTIGHVTMLEKWFPLLPEAKAEFIAAYIGINDMILGQEDNKQWLDDLTPRKRTQRWRQTIRNHSALFRAYRIGAGWLKARSAKLTHGASPDTGAQWVAVDPQPARGRTHTPRLIRKDLLERYAGRVTRLIKTIRELGSRPVIISQGVNGYRLRNGVLHGRRTAGGADTGLYTHMADYNAVAMETCANLQAVCIDLFNELAFEDGDFYDGYHTTPQGSRRIAEYLFRKLRPVVGGGS